MERQIPDVIDPLRDRGHLGDPPLLPHALVLVGSA
jgi:hypothetical protein